MYIVFIKLNTKKRKRYLVPRWVNHWSYVQTIIGYNMKRTAQTAQNSNKSFTRHRASCRSIWPRGFGYLNHLSSQSSPRFSFFRYDSHYIKVWHSIYPTGNAVLSQSAGRCFAPLQAEIAPKSPFLCVNRSLILCVFLRGPAKELSGKVWTYESGNDPCSWMFDFLTR